MRHKIQWWLPVLGVLVAGMLLLCACSIAFAARSDTQETATAAQTQPTLTVQVPQPSSVLDGVTIEAPQQLEASADSPQVSFSVSFRQTEQAIPEQAPLCTLRLYRDGKLVNERFNFALVNGAKASFSARFAFFRYMAKSAANLTLVLECGAEKRSFTIPVSMENWPDEVYAAKSGDPYPYHVDVIRNQNVVIVYGKDEAGEYTQIVKAFPCSTGWGTPTGEFTAGARYEWRALYGGVFGQYATLIVNDILFHSVPYTQMSKDALKYEEYNKLGEEASLGCVRLCVADCKWIFENCPQGTEVDIFDSDTLPVEKPVYEKIDPESPNRGWDPTDPDPENPWNTESAG